MTDMTMRQIREALGHAAPGIPDAIVQPTEYEVSILPEGDINRHVFAITVEYRGVDQWAITRHGMCLGSDGEWAEGTKPHDRGDDWLRAHRFDLTTALRLARMAAPHVVVNGHSALDAYRRTPAV
ncbi:hypothetical protein PV409_36315 [Streptomyces sp. ME02-6979.5a]|uniref:hypothetical protein n=1 Tax=Streptomyces sp. ME02-6979.5a TaxID=462925 RepID=UPI0029A0FA81|nr:hypothetical protein [Streptomyces sp. ME02-6979.5a]MDX3343426.1 hypothetical protein [Streptomyces sp. ME02-6979.5a]